MDSHRCHSAQTTLSKCQRVSGSRSKLLRMVANKVERSGMEWNGVEWNGMEWNAMEWNGTDWNGVEWTQTDSVELPMVRVEHSNHPNRSALKRCAAISMRNRNHFTAGQIRFRAGHSDLLIATRSTPPESYSVVLRTRPVDDCDRSLQAGGIA